MDTQLRRVTDFTQIANRYMQHVADRYTAQGHCIHLYSFSVCSMQQVKQVNMTITQLRPVNSDIVAHTQIVTVCSMQHISGDQDTNTNLRWVTRGIIDFVQPFSMVSIHFLSHLNASFRIQLFPHFLSLSLFLLCFSPFSFFFISLYLYPLISPFWYLALSKFFFLFFFKSAVSLKIENTYHCIVLRSNNFRN